MIIANDTSSMSINHVLYNAHHRWSSKMLADEKRKNTHKQWKRNTRPALTNTDDRLVEALLHLHCFSWVKGSIVGFPKFTTHPSQFSRRAAIPLKRLLPIFIAVHTLTKVQAAKSIREMSCDFLIIELSALHRHCQVLEHSQVKYWPMFGLYIFISNLSKKYKKQDFSKITKQIKQLFWFKDGTQQKSIDQNIPYFFKYSCTNIFHRRSLYTFYFYQPYKHTAS